MIDSGYWVRKGYYDKLNGTVLLNSVAVSVYDTMAPNEASYPYIILSTQTAVDDSVKRCQGQEVTMLLDIVTGFTGAVSRVPIDTISNQIFQLINPANMDFINTGPDLRVISTRLLSDTTMAGQNDVYKTLRRLIRFGHKIHEQVTL